jgi:phosphate/sulfate permease
MDRSLSGCPKWPIIMPAPRSAEVMLANARHLQAGHPSLPAWGTAFPPDSASFVSFSHGANDAQKTMGVITLALGALAYAVFRLVGTA